MRPIRAVATAITASLALVFAGCNSGPAGQAISPGSGGNARIGGVSANNSLSDPPYFLYASPGGPAELRSPSSGAVIKVLGQFDQALTNNGFAESPDGKDAYVTLIGKKQLFIEQISTVTRKQTFFANGVQPAVSPNEHYLAYAAGPNDIDILAVRNLSTGKTTLVNLSSLMGSSMNLLNGTITWLGDSSDIVVIPAGDAVATASSTSPSTASTATSCSALPKATCIIVVHLGVSNGAFTSHLVVILGISGNFKVFSGADMYSRTLIVATWGENTNLYNITLSGSTADVIHLLTLPMVLPVAFDLLGKHFFYITGHGPTELWVAKIASGHLVEAQRLTDNPTGEIAW